MNRCARSDDHVPTLNNKNKDDDDDENMKMRSLEKVEACSVGVACHRVRSEEERVCANAQKIGTQNTHLSFVRERTDNKTYSSEGFYRKRKETARERKYVSIYISM
jgi:hypothetical protein